jgi:hypothetical protein
MNNFRAIGPLKEKEECYIKADFLAVDLWRIADRSATSTIKFLSTFFESSHFGRSSFVGNSHSERMYYSHLDKNMWMAFTLNGVDG